MVDVVLTPANVLRGANARTEAGIAGVAIAAGQTVYKDANDSGRFKLADSNSATAAARVVYGIALHAASTGQPLTVLRGGDITIGGTLVTGTVYVQSANPGGIAPVADLSAGQFTTTLGIAKSTTVLAVELHTAGVAI